MPVNNLTRLSVEQQEEVRCEMAHVRMGHLRLDRASSKFGNVRYVTKSRSKLRAFSETPYPLRVDGAAGDVIQAPKPEPRIMPIRRAARCCCWCRPRPAPFAFPGSCAMLVALRLVEVEAQLGAMASARLISSKSRTITAGTREKPTAMEAANR